MFNKLHYVIIVFILKREERVKEKSINSLQSPEGNRHGKTCQTAKPNIRYFKKISLQSVS